jgi:hypothetical protein
MQIPGLGIGERTPQKAAIAGDRLEPLPQAESQYLFHVCRARPTSKKRDSPGGHSFGTGMAVRIRGQADTETHVRNVVDEPPITGHTPVGGRAAQSSKHSARVTTDEVAEQDSPRDR